MYLQTVCLKVFKITFQIKCIFGNIRGGELELVSPELSTLI